MKRKHKMYYCALVVILFSLSLGSQDASNSEYSQIKQLIQSRQLNKAREQLKLAMVGNENDPTLNLYQTELWIMEGESYYSSGDYKKALEIYQKAIEYYPSNPMVNAKYQEMVNKVKSKNLEAKENKPHEPLPIQPLGLQGKFPMSGESSQNPGTVNFTLSRTDFLLTILCLENFLLLLFLFFRLRR